MAPETPTSDYELRRQENIRRNAEMMTTLKLRPSSSLKPRRYFLKKSPPPPSPSSIRRSLRNRGLSPERFPKLTDPNSFLSTASSSPSNPAVISKTFNPSLSMILKPENSAVVLPKIISTLRFLPFNDRTVVVAGNAVGDLGFWVVDSANNGAGLFSCSPHSSLITGISVHPSCPGKVYTSSYDRYVRVMDVEREDLVTGVCSSVSDSFYCVSQWVEDGNLLYVGEGEGKLRVWDERAGKGSSFLGLHTRRINNIDFSPVNSNLMVTGSSDGVALWWDVRYMREDRIECLSRVVHERVVNSAYFSPSGSCVATTSDDDRVGILSGVNFEEQVMIPHKNRGVKLVSSTRGVWGWDDSYLFLGNLERAVDVIFIKNRTTVALESQHMTTTPQQLAAHPRRLGSLATATAGGKVFMWTEK